MKRVVLGGVVAVLLAGVGLWWLSTTPSGGDGAEGAAAKSGGRPAEVAAAPSAKRTPAAAVASVPAAPPAADDAADAAAEGDDVPQTADEKAAADEERRVEAFYALTDAWMEPVKRDVALEDIEKFRATFASVPKHRREECLQRALNLVPDENVMLLAGILMDKEQDRKLVELVFNDVLNRDEEVKMPLLQEIFKDKTHPCWADTAWILDVTGAAKAGVR